MAEVGNRTGRQTQAGRDVYETPEGEMVSEKSTTFEYEGKWINVPTIHGGKQYSEDQLMEMLNKGLIKPTSVHDELEEAIEAAQKRSDSLKFNRGGTLMLEKQMELFNDGGLYDEGGMIDEVSGNDVPPGSTRSEVRDDIPAMLSEGEFVFPADVVRYFGLEKLMKMRQEAKSGLKMMDAMGQMGNSDEATIEDDLPFDVAELMLVDMEEDENENEFNKGGMPVKLAPGGVPNRADILAGTDTSATIAGGAYTNVPTSSGILMPEYRTGASATTGGLTFKRYTNAQGIVINVPFQNNEPLYPIPAGFTKASETTVAEPEVEPTPSEGRDGPVFVEPTSAADIKSLEDLTDEEISRGLTTGRTAGRIASTVAGFANPILGGLTSIGTKARYNDLLEEAQRRGLSEAEGKSRLGSIFGGEASLLENLKDISGDKKIDFGDTWLGDLLGVDGEAGVQGPGLKDSRKGARRSDDGRDTTTDVSERGSSGKSFGADARAEQKAGQVDPALDAPNPRAASLRRAAKRAADKKKKEDKVDPALDAPNPRAASVDAAAKRAADKKKKEDKEDRDKRKARSAERALVVSRAGTKRVLDNLQARSKEEGKSNTEIMNERYSASKEARKVESALKDISKGVQRGFNQGGLASRKQITNNNPINKDRGVAARKKK
jgi:hypothetical protein